RNDSRRLTCEAVTATACGSYLAPRPRPIMPRRPIIPRCGDAASSSSQKIRLHHVLLQHALSIEKGAIERDGVAHDTEEALPVAIEQRHNDPLEFVVERCGVLGPV